LTSSVSIRLLKHYLGSRRYVPLATALVHTDLELAPMQTGLLPVDVPLRALNSPPPPPFFRLASGHFVDG
jgi:hypothetical protein